MDRGCWALKATLCAIGNVPSMSQQAAATKGTGAERHKDQECRLHMWPVWIGLKDGSIISTFIRPQALEGQVVCR